MKKLIFAVFTMAAMFVACGNKTSNNTKTVDSVDTTSIIDTICTD